ncbi:TPA: hypothetical protein DIU27_02100 [Candidatus Collierbacteria bacterium]|uniref:Type II secretion system protein G n=1 Tax=Candidatus Collierbacteria bacterium GW2011_GWB2_44_22 TaxID=1618387 RepID=A0A0G1KVR0_9BACT|nr:MAG: Type II secretion system protein G [Candidatus Collierbacteria bacterium GW2011_GWA2_44_13]KKT51538.1 MAG: Type II secretion system protein G [Candidatus Collierbacteria bacterium GW2011_GWB1_44_197]KKT52009.1 MAG: Type II secretion system protein G [Candidatus Collierbacteria bacterium GW2011_GWB2_44_22]KKT62133.1 MAG: Type II secretion system protein G [Candidatus Collierbacteria bacterium GW2011_GWD1_44_27]KKT66703.1 MAG: Type II secretion system protein G [Candidatus Collierbacteria
MKRNGYTFVELLVVISIIGIIFAVGVVSFTAITTRSRDTRRKSDMEAIRQALEMCRSLTGTYPSSIYDDVSCSLVGPVLLKSTPKDPKPCTDQIGAYTYNPLSATTYTLSASCMEIDTGYEVTNP